MAGPIEGMEFESCGFLAGGFARGIHLIERQPAAVPLVEIDSGGENGNDRK